MKYRKRPLVIDALQLRWETWSEMCKFVGVGRLKDGKPEGCWINPKNGLPGPEGCSEEIGLSIPTLEGVMVARQNDWIIKGIQGEFYPCRPEIFEATYESVP